MQRRELLIGSAVVLVAIVSALVVGAALAESVGPTKMEPAVPGGPTPSDGGAGETTTPSDGAGNGNGDGNGDGAADGTATPTPSDGGAGTETPTDGDGEAPKMLVEVSQPSEGVADNQSATIQVTLRSAEGEPVDGATLKLQSIGTSGEFDPGAEISTDSEGRASVEWIYHQPTEAEDYAKMPPSEQTSIAVQTTVDGAQVSKFVTVKLNIDPYMEGCHSEGEDL
jgi:hypothetical protein